MVLAGSGSKWQALGTRLEPPWRSALAVFLISAAATASVAMLAPAALRVESSDYLSYYEPVARGLLAGEGFTDPNGNPAVYYPPGQPVVLAGVFGLAELLGMRESTAFLAFTILCMGLSSTFLYAIARSVWGAVPAFLSPLVWIAYPFVQFFTLQHSKEIPFLTLFYGAVWALWHALRSTGPGRASLSFHFLAGLLIGLAMLIVPSAIGAGAVMAAAVWLIGSERAVRARLVSIAMLVLGNLVAVGPWEAWAFSATGRVIPLAANGPQSVINGYTWAVRPTPYRQSREFPPDILELMKDIYDRECANELGTLGEVGLALVEEALERSPAMAKLLAIKTARSWYGTDSQRLDRTILLVQIPFVVLILWSTRMAWRRGGAARQLAIVVWLLAFYFWSITTLIALSLLRYMVPAIGLLFVLLPGAVRRTRPA